MRNSVRQSVRNSLIVDNTDRAFMEDPETLEKQRRMMQPEEVFEDKWFVLNWLFLAILIIWTFGLIVVMWIISYFCSYSAPTSKG